VKKVLIIDDEPDILAVMEAIVRLRGHVVFTADNAASGLAICRSEKPDIVLLDLHMPGMDGLEACRVMRQDKEISTIPVVFVTASTSSPEKKVSEAGADGYLIKPFQTEDLIAIVEQCTGK
jgi:CheY-like chemotaxis protein